MALTEWIIGAAVVEIVNPGAVERTAKALLRGLSTMAANMPPPLPPEKPKQTQFETCQRCGKLTSLGGYCFSVECRRAQFKQISAGQRSPKREDGQRRSRRNVRGPFRRLNPAPRVIDVIPEAVTEAEQLNAAPPVESQPEESPCQETAKAQPKKTNRHGSSGRLSRKIKPMCLDYCTLRLSGVKHQAALKRAAEAAVEKEDYPDYNRALRALRRPVREKLENGRNPAALRRFLRGH
jgi:hypothetical protein